MTPKEMVLRILDDIPPEGGDTWVRALPPKSPAELEELQQMLGGRSLPAEIKELLELTAGLMCNGLGCIDFSGGYPFELKEVFPYSVPILPDDRGNFWVVDVNGRTGVWGAVFFACHDPMVIIVQSSSLTAFLGQVNDALTKRTPNLLEFVTADAVASVQESASNLLSVKEARQAPDSTIRSFAESLPESFGIVDLRELRIGSGFSLWKCGSNVKVKRWPGELLWAVEFSKMSPFIKRLFSQGLLQA